MQAHASLLPATWRIPQDLRDRLGDRAGRQRVMEADGHLLIVLHAPPQPDQPEREGRYFWRQPDGTWSAVGGPGGPGALVTLLDEYEAAIARLDQMEETADGARDYFEVLTRLTPLARSARNMFDTLQEARRAAPDDRRLILARDRAYSLSRSAELLDSDARHALDFAIARQAEEQAASSHKMAVASHRLNLLVAFFFPVATLSAIFGSNLRHGLDTVDEAAGPLPLLAMVAIGMFLGVALTVFVTRPAPAPETRIESRTAASKSKL